MSKSEAWEDYAEKYNKLSEELIAKGIDPTKLKEVIEAARVLEKLKNS
jgi:hypothetical protein